MIFSLTYISVTIFFCLRSDLFFLSTNFCQSSDKNMDAADFFDDEFMQTIDVYALEFIASSATSTHELAR